MPPLYGPDNHAARHIAGHALAAFVRDTCPDERVSGVMIGDLAYPGDAVTDRVKGIDEGARELLAGLKFAQLDTAGQGVRADALLTKLL